MKKNKTEIRKESYETPEMEIVVFETEDIITTSGGEIPGGDLSSLFSNLR